MKKITLQNLRLKNVRVVYGFIFTWGLCTIPPLLAMLTILSPASVYAFIYDCICMGHFQILCSLPYLSVLKCLFSYLAFFICFTLFLIDKIISHVCRMPNSISTHGCIFSDPTRALGIAINSICLSLTLALKTLPLGILNAQYTIINQIRSVCRKLQFIHHFQLQLYTHWPISLHLPYPSPSQSLAITVQFSAFQIPHKGENMQHSSFWVQFISFNVMSYTNPAMLLKMIGFLFFLWVKSTP